MILKHNLSNGACNSYEAYLGEPAVTLSLSGTRVLFSSDWYDSGSVDTFVVELPSFTRLTLDGEWTDNQRSSMVTKFTQAGAKFAFSRAATDTTDEGTHFTIGSGQIHGKQIDLDYVTTVANKPVSGQCSASEKRDVDNITFTCDDKDAGLADFSIVRKQLSY
jgi:hypothetical protein